MKAYKRVSLFQVGLSKYLEINQNPHFRTSDLNNLAHEDNVELFNILFKCNEDGIKKRSQM